VQRCDVGPRERLGERRATHRSNLLEPARIGDQGLRLQLCGVVGQEGVAQLVNPQCGSPAGFLAGWVLTQPNRSAGVQGQPAGLVGGNLAVVTDHVPAFGDSASAWGGSVQKDVDFKAAWSDFDPEARNVCVELGEGFRTRLQGVHRSLGNLPPYHHDITTVQPTKGNGRRPNKPLCDDLSTT
jgi:hypothetical protein